MLQQHPITPQPELRRLWTQEAQRMDPHDPVAWQEHVAAQAARWGADAELEACCQWLREAKHHGLGYEVGAMLADKLSAAMRPKPPSLAEEAQRILVENSRTFGGCVQFDLEDVVTIRRALERLQELENNG